MKSGAQARDFFASCQIRSSSMSVIAVQLVTMKPESLIPMEAAS